MGKWESKTLGSIVNKITKGTTPTTNGFRYLSNGIPFVKVENLKNNRIDFETINHFISNEANEAQARSILEENDLLYSIAGTIGKIAIVNKEDLPLNTNQALAIIRGYSKYLIPDFLKYTLTSEILSNTKSKARGGALKNISLTDIKNTLVPLPPLPEQRAIVAKLDELFERIDKAIALVKENIAHTEALMGSVLDEEFARLDCANFRIKEIAKTTSGGTPLRSNKEFYKDGTIPWLKSGELNDSLSIKSNSEFITEDAVNNSSAKIFKKNTLLMAMYGATAGKLGILGMDAATNQAVCSIQNNEDKFENLYVFYFLKSQRERIIRESSGGAQPNISKGYIDKIEIPLPDLKTQKQLSKKFVKYQEKTDLVTTKHIETLSYLENLKQSLLDVAFKGELV